MEIKPILSVLVTFCNQVRYIEDCLLSLLGQKTGYPFEILVAIDGEDDGSMALLEKYSQEYANIRYWKVYSDSRKLALSRASNNRIFLLKQAVGKYLIILDGDDFFCSDRRFEEGIHFLESHNDIMAHSCDWIYYHDDTKSFSSIRNCTSQEINLKKYLSGELFICLAMNLFRNIFLGGEEYPEPDFFDDTVLTTFLMSKGSFYFSAEPMFAYRVGIESCFASCSEADRKLLPLVTCVIKKKLIGYEEYFDSLISGYVNFIEKHTEDLSEELKRQVLFQGISIPIDLAKIGSDEIADKAKCGKKVCRLLRRTQYRSEKVRLSVLIITCQQVKYIADCLESVLNQECDFPYEVLVAIDGKDDGTMSLLKEYSDKYSFIKVWKVNSDKNLLALSRASENRLFLLDKARGDYFYILDGDDFLIDKNWFAEAVFFMDRHEEYIGYACELIKYDEKEHSFQLGFEEKNHYTYAVEMCATGYYYLSSSCCIFKNIFKNKETVYPEHYFFDDDVLKAILLLRGDIFCSGKPGFAYRINCNSTFSGINSISRELIRISLFLKLYQIVKLKDYLRELAICMEFIIKDGTFSFGEDISRQILYQNIPIARDFVRIREFSEEERQKFLHRVNKFLKHRSKYKLFWKNHPKLARIKKFFSKKTDKIKLIFRRGKKASAGR